MASQTLDDENENNIFERPLSPVLSNSKINRKLLLARKRQSKSRVKLTNRFPQEVSVNRSGDDTFSSTPAERISATIEREQPNIQKREETIFKTPESPIVKKIKKNLKVSECVGFKTAGGRSINIYVSEEMIAKSKSLFDDILNPNSDTSRSKKYSFLTKKQTVDMCSNDSDSKIQYVNGERITPSDDLLCTQETKLLFSNFTLLADKITEKQKINTDADLKGFSEEDVCDSRQKVEEFRLMSNKLIYQSKHLFLTKENVLKDTKFISIKRPWDTSFNSLREDLKVRKGELTVTSTKSRDVLQSFAFRVGVEVDNHDEEEIFSTQETNQLFSDFTLIEDKIVENHSSHNLEDFKGFDENCIDESRVKFEEIISFLENNDNEVTLRPIQELSSITLKSEDMNKGFSTAARNKPNGSKTTLAQADFIFNKKTYLISNFKSSDTKYSFAQTGFKTAAGAPLSLSENGLRKAEKIFRSINSDCSLNDVVTLSSDIPVKNPTFEQNSVQNIQVSTGFQTARGTAVSLSDSALDKAKKIFQNIDEVPSFSGRKPFAVKQIDNEESKSFTGFKTAGGSKVTLSESALNKAKRIFENVDHNSLDGDIFKSKNSPVGKIQSEIKIKANTGFKTTAGNALSFSESDLNKAKRIFENLNSTPSSFLELEDTKSISAKYVQSVTETTLNSSESALKKNKDIFDDSGSSCNDSTTNRTFIDENSAISANSNYLNDSTKMGNVRRKRRLGMSSCKPIKIPKHKIEEAKKIFDDVKTPVMSPLRNNKPSIYNSTPLKDAQVIHIDSDITPIKNVHTVVFKETKTEKSEIGIDGILMCASTKGSIDTWSDALEEKRKKLELELRIIFERREALSVQKHFLENANNDYKKRRTGILYEKKQGLEKESLQKFLKINNTHNKKFNITPQNAESVHFNFTIDNISTIVTSDGACVVPNIQDLVGLSEIEVAFRAMRGVDIKLIPQGWIKNHFKWIVWKLASYENFALNMQNSLTVENIIQQLKYRYDREIDRVERSAIRKILEKDDAPQKRMVLCVSNIFDLRNGKFELELMDGWYSIRTNIDEPLCQQIMKRKIQIGTKLVVYGAELLNCDGCHPLEATDLIRLKISCNSTRRTKWYTKLGYQKHPEPFPVKLNSILPNGGITGCIKIFIARVYPVKYMEKQNNLNVWRNRKAEDLREQEWENKGRGDIERVREFIQKDCELTEPCLRRNVGVSINENEIRTINSPETLYNLYQSSKDPERLEEILSHSQKQYISDYRQQTLLRQQQELSRKMADSFSRLQNQRRDVTPVLQLLVVDFLDRQEKSSILQIWKPSDTHLDIIKESAVFNVYNVVPKKNGNLSTTSRSKFQLHSGNFPEYNKYKRTLFPISKTLKAISKPIFNEFDTVGIVVSFSVNSCDQNIWLTDSSRSLLFIKIFEGPKNCLLLDKLKIGQVVAVSNLIFRESKMEFGEAVANHLTIISCYPQHKHLQEGIDALNRELPKNLTAFLQECNEKITYYIDKVDITKDCQSSSSKSLVKSNSLVPSDFFDDSSDALFSMLNVEELK